MPNQPPKPSPDVFPTEAKSDRIHLALDEYEDIFSDFDSRPYSERMLSDDFLFELKRASLDREDKGLTLTLLVPKEGRKPADEKVILERLKAHFRRQRKKLEEKRRGEKRLGMKMIALGIVFMFTATWILFKYKETLWSAFIVVLLEPAGWFTFWEGLNLLLFHAKESTPDLGFYRKLAGAKIVFTS